MNHPSTTPISLAQPAHLSSAASANLAYAAYPSVGKKEYAAQQGAAGSRKVAFLGLGTMGYPMAGHLVLAGHQVTVYNRTAAKAQAWVAEFGASGAAAAQSPAEAARGADLVFCCVGNDADVAAVALGEGLTGDAVGVFSVMAPGAVFIDHTTTSATLARRLGEAAQQRGLCFIDAPVSGGQLGAKNGVLTVMCGADEADFAMAAPIMTAYARAVTRMGAVGTGQLTKMVNQICIAGLLQGLSEALAFGSKVGLDLPLVLDVISKGAAQSWQMENRGKTMVAGEFDFGFAVDWMRKDLGLLLDEAQRHGASLPVTELVDRFYQEVQAAGGGRWDTSSLITRLG